MKREHGGKRESHPREVIDFSSNVNCFGPPEGVRRLFTSDLSGEITDYPDPDYPRLKGALSGYTGRKPDEIFLSNGSVEIFYLLCFALRPGKALVISPSFCEYVFAARSAGAEVVEHFLKPDNGFILNFGKAAVPAREADLVFLGNPNSPTGNLLTPDDVMRLASGMKPGAVLLVDEAFMDFCGGSGGFSFSGKVDERVWVARSLTKFFSLAGLRIGYLLAPPRAVAALEGGAPPWRVNRLAEMAAIAALSDRSFIDEARERTARERERFAGMLEGVSYLRPFPAAANFILVEIDHEELDAPMLKELLLSRGFLVRDASSFSGLDRRFMRLAVRGGEDNAALVRELAALDGRGGRA